MRYPVGCLRFKRRLIRPRMPSLCIFAKFTQSQYYQCSSRQNNRNEFKSSLWLRKGLIFACLNKVMCVTENCIICFRLLNQYLPSESHRIIVVEPQRVITIGQSQSFCKQIQCPVIVHCAVVHQVGSKSTAVC